MNLDLTLTEFRRLIHLVYIASWVLGAHKTEEDVDTAPYRQLERKQFAIAARHGLSDLVTYFPKYDCYLPTAEIEEGEARVFLDEYDDDNFLEELIHLLAERDVINDLGSPEAFVDLSGERRVTLLARHQDHYADEFNEHGLDRLTFHTKEEEA